MRVWMVTIGEPLPIDGEERKWRGGMLCKMMVERGHQVTWWTSTFDHVRKRYRRNADDRFIVPGGGYEMIMLHGPSYPRNVSLRRIRHNISYARRFRRMAPLEPAPDVILCTLPPTELAAEAVRFGRERDVPVALDIRDLWPDSIVDVAPRWMRAPARLALWPMYRDLRFACTGARALTGTTPHLVSWGVGYSGRDATADDRDFPMAYTSHPPSAEAVERGRAMWQKRGLRLDGSEFIACYFGAMGPSHDLETVILAGKRLAADYPALRIVLAGHGDALDGLRTFAAGADNVLLPGWIDRGAIASLMKSAAVGLTPYHTNTNFIGAIPNKPVEYMSAGLPVVSSLAGTLEQLLADNDCGVTYPNEDVERAAAVLAELHDDKVLRERLARNALQLYERRFVAEKVYPEMIDWLEGLARRAGAPVAPST